MLYDLIELLHIVAVVLWLGGGVLLILKAIRAERSDNVADLQLSLKIRSTLLIGFSSQPLL
jgi:uncharacterized membrane protein